MIGAVLQENGYQAVENREEIEIDNARLLTAVCYAVPLGREARKSTSSGCRVGESFCCKELTASRSSSISAAEWPSFNLSKLCASVLQASAKTRREYMSGWRGDCCASGSGFTVGPNSTMKLEFS